MKRDKDAIIAVALAIALVFAFLLAHPLVEMVP